MVAKPLAIQPGEGDEFNDAAAIVGPRADPRGRDLLAKIHLLGLDAMKWFRSLASVWLSNCECMGLGLCRLPQCDKQCGG